MARTGTITLYEGVSKANNKPFTALKLTVGEWDQLYFVNSKFELDYIKKCLTAPVDSVDVSTSTGTLVGSTPTAQPWS